MIKWLWKLIVGEGCWGRSCKWGTVKSGNWTVPDMEGGRRTLGFWSIQRCTVCGLEKGRMLLDGS